MPKLIPKSQKIVHMIHQKVPQKVIFNHQNQKTVLPIEKPIPSIKTMKTEVPVMNNEISAIRTEPNQSFHEKKETGGKKETQVFFHRHPIHPNNFVYTPKVTILKEKETHFPFSTRNQEKKEVKFEEKE